MKPYVYFIKAGFERYCFFATMRKQVNLSAVSGYLFIPEREHNALILSVESVLLPYGNEKDDMKYTPTSIGLLVRTTRKAQGLTQADLALTCGTGLRFVIDLEKGKPSCQFGKVLTVLQTLGITIDFDVPPAPIRGGA